MISIYRYFAGTEVGGEQKYRHVRSSVEVGQHFYIFFFIGNKLVCFPIKCLAIFQPVLLQVCLRPVQVLNRSDASAALGWEIPRPPCGHGSQ